MPTNCGRGVRGNIFGKDSVNFEIDSVRIRLYPNPNLDLLFGFAESESELFG